MNAALLALALVGAAPAPLARHSDAPPAPPCVLRVGVGPTRAYAVYLILPRGEFRCGGWTGHAVYLILPRGEFRCGGWTDNPSLKPSWFVAIVRWDPSGREGSLEYVAGRDQGIALWCALDDD